ncbi:hypothetical protein N8T08_001963 [Aspergillus melleus]|uniref:Uncharacterized protein n=1 Tax=Aspergillus melleus TaxID=138277 RepID=A0ACC3B9B4_9EURO|nr:hypothetical protein N8T08_001963 [Aspergillus melleus]
MAAMNFPPSQSALCTLLLECRQAVLCHLPDLHALKAIILTHPTLYAAYVSNQTAILRRIVLQLISPELLPDAVLAITSSRLNVEPWTRAKAFSNLEEHRRAPRRIPSSFRWTFRTATQLETLHDHVKFLAKVFVSAASAECLDSNGAGSPAAFIALRYTKADFKYVETWDAYYKHFAAWELEQIAAVGEYLFRVIAIPFNDIAEHDIEWGISGYRLSAVRSLGLRMGLTYSKHWLAFLHKVMKAETYDERYRLLTPVAPSILTFLPCDLASMMTSDIDDTLPLEDYSQEQIQPYLTPDAPEPDPGPREAWRYVHLNSPWPFFICDLEARDVRRWGYVMWDQYRLEQLKFFDTPFVPSPIP